MLYTSRSTVRPGDLVLAWSPEGRLDAAKWRLTCLRGEAVPAEVVPFARRGSTWWDDAYFAAVRVPREAADGPAMLFNEADLEATAALTLDREWSAGHMRPFTDFSRPPYRMQYEPSRWGVIEGQEVVGRPEGLELFHWPDGRLPENVTLRGCRFRHVVLTGGRLPGLLVEDCDFDSCSVRSLVGPAMFVRCRFRGMAPPLYPETQVTGGGVAFVDCTWEDVGNGISFQTTHGAIEGSLVTGAVMRGLNLTRNGSDGIAVEGGHEFYRNLVLHLRYEGEGHIFNLWKIAGTRNVFREYLGRGGMGANVVPPDGRPEALADNVFCGGELIGTSQAPPAMAGAATANHWSRPAWVAGTDDEKTVWSSQTVRGNLW